MTALRKLLFLPGDGIGPEVLDAAKAVADWFAENRGFAYDAETRLVGGAACKAEGVPVSADTMAEAKAADAVLFGAVGGPEFDGLAFDKRPEAGLLALRSELELFANLRPALCFASLSNASSLKRDKVSGLDILIVRELTGGVYFGEPRGIEDLGGGKKRGVNTHVYDSDEIRRIARIGFEMAGMRGARLTSVEKRNVMEAGLLWHEEVSALHASDYADIKLDHMLADNCAMQLVRQPKQFDVILTDNLFGDLLSDIAAQLTGSLGMLPSASLAAVGANGLPQAALFEPVHGSAPDIAGKDIANPLAAILSLGMAFRYALARAQDADLLDEAVNAVLEEGWRTPDIAAGANTERKTSTSGMTKAVLAALAKKAGA